MIKKIITIEQLTIAMMSFGNKSFNAVEFFSSLPDYKEQGTCIDCKYSDYDCHDFIYCSHEESSFHLDFGCIYWKEME